MTLQHQRGRNALTWLSLAILVASAHCKKAALRCHSIGGLQFNNSDIPIKFPLTACPQQSHFTCCGAETDTYITRMHTLCELAGQQAGSRGVSKCCSMMKTLQCFACDGVAALQQPFYVCDTFCNAVYDACRDVVMSWDAVGAPQICNSDAVACSALDNFVTSGREMCTLLGYPVSSLQDAAGAECYTGRAHYPSEELLASVAQQVNVDETQEIAARRTANKYASRTTEASPGKSLLSWVWSSLGWAGQDDSGAAQLGLAIGIGAFLLLKIFRR